MTTSNAGRDTRREEKSGAEVVTEGPHLTIRIAVPDASAGIGAQLVFAARSDSLEGPLRWARYRAAHRALTERSIESGDGADPGALFDDVTTIAAEYAVAARVTQHQAEGFLTRAFDCFVRIPRIGECLRDALITPRTFETLRHETALIEDPEILEYVDGSIADWIRGHGAHSACRAGEAARRIVSRHDPDAARRRTDAGKAFKAMGSTPLDGRLSRLQITADAEDVRLSEEVVNAVADGVCAADPRNRSERRADAAVALLQRRRFECGCGNSECSAATSDDEVAARCARIVLHVVVRKETLDGLTDLPAYMDGDGPIAADHVAELRRRSDVVERELDPAELLTDTAQTADPHEPTTTCATVVRALFGRCSWPGCERPAYRCDLDHVCEYNSRNPEAGGATCWCNLNPKCRFHHLLKTTLDEWLDDQIVDADGRIWTEVLTPTGIRSRIEAANTWLLPEVGSLPCRHGPPADPGVPGATEPRRSRSRTENKHRYRMRRRAENRRIRRRAETVAPPPVDYGEPDF